jgi:replicative DNA helicase
LGKAAEAAKLFRVDFFSTTSYREIFLAIRALVEAGEGESALEVTQLAAELRRRGKLSQVGGWSILCDLTTGVVVSLSMESRARKLQRYALRRRLIAIFAEIEKRALDLTWPVEADKTTLLLVETATNWLRGAA